MTKTEHKAIAGFISDLASQDYKKANASLENIVEIKLKQRVSQAAAEKITSNQDK